MLPRLPYLMLQSAYSVTSVKIRLIIFLLSLLCMLVAACGPPPEKSSKVSVPAVEKKTSKPKKTVVINHLSGEVLAVNAKAKTITILSRDEEINLSFDDKTVVKLDLEAVNPTDIPLGIRATIKYLERKGEFVAQGIFISTKTAGKKNPLSYSFHNKAA